ncbi:unnamed protein product [Calicophoron daubneyi]|uniref:39S ribosomal protein L28, mitochondrial n=1 Tax=Calicophoron daubneyi TaxID=300641 RepID=A0AAV2T0I6_CALDB
MSRILYYEHVKPIIARLPEHYKRRYLESHQTKPESKVVPPPVLVGRSKFVNYLSPGAYCDIPPKVIYPPESQRCLWGNEGILSGYVQKKETSPICPKMWGPSLSQQIFYSEILNRYMIIIVSEAVLSSIESLGGFDQYILSTPEESMHSRLGMHLKRDMLKTLSDPNFCASNREKRESILSRYSKYVLPREEAEWVGLTLEEAVKKQTKLEYEVARLSVRPRKIDLTEKLLEELKSPTPPETVEQKPKWSQRIFSKILPRMGTGKQR